MYPCFDKLIAKFKYGFEKVFNAQDCLVSIIVDKGNQADPILADLSEAFYCIDYELSIERFHAYGFGKNSLYFIHLYLKGRT